MSELTWTELRAPADEYDADALTLIQRYVDVANAIDREFWPKGDHDTTVDEIVVSLQRTQDWRARRFLISESGVDVAKAIASIPTDEAARIAQVNVGVVPTHRGRGIGRRIAPELERIAIGLGAQSLQAWIDHRSPRDGDERLEPVSGHGAIVPDAAAHLARSLGYSLEQVERISTLDVLESRGSLERHLADARATAGDAYELRTWVGRTPKQLAAGLAALVSRMATDAPAAGLDVDELVWDEARLERSDSHNEAAGLTLLYAVAIHVASGEPVAYTTFVVPNDPMQSVYQDDTLVRADHRGHRLGMLVKAANLLQLAQFAPDRATVTTWNAEENAPMLDVNVALGFRPVAAEGGWQRVLSDEERAAAGEASQ